MNCLDCERELAEDRCLCQRCTSKLDRHLADLPAMYDALGAYLRLSSQTSTAVGCSKSPDAPLPLAEPALDLRGPGGMVHVLEDWRAALHSELAIAAPEPFGDYPGRLARAVRALRGHLPYVAVSWSEAGQLAREVRELHGAGCSIVAPPEKTIRVGLCPAELGDGTVCGAVLRAVPGDPAIRCRWCNIIYPPSTWLSLSLAQKEAAA